LNKKERLKRIVLAALSDIAQDQRLMRIAGSLQQAGYDVLLVGKNVKGSLPLLPAPYRQRRIRCFLSRGKLYYFEFNIKLFFYLLFRRIDCICAVDLDTIMTSYWISRLKRCARVYDAHEYFSQMKEVIRRPGIQRFWQRIERFAIPRFPLGYTVSDGIATELKKEFGVQYAVIRNLPRLSLAEMTGEQKKIFLYQGAINEGRALDALLMAMAFVPAPVWLYGDGNFRDELTAMVNRAGAAEKFVLKGKLPPAELQKVNAGFYAGINLVEREGLNQYFSLANKFFDYIHAGLPQVTMNFPEYAAVNQHFEVAILIDDLQPKTIANAMNRLLDDQDLYLRLKNNCIAAKNKLNWEEEEQKLISFYRQVL